MSNVEKHKANTLQNLTRLEPNSIDQNDALKQHMQNDAHF